jgi:hypothetical protein
MGGARTFHPDFWYWVLQVAWLNGRLKDSTAQTWQKSKEVDVCLECMHGLGVGSWDWSLDSGDWRLGENLRRRLLFTPRLKSLLGLKSLCLGLDFTSPLLSSFSFWRLASQLLILKDKMSPDQDSLQWFKQGKHHEPQWSGFLMSNLWKDKSWRHSAKCTHCQEEFAQAKPTQLFSHIKNSCATITPENKSTYLQKCLADQTATSSKASQHSNEDHHCISVSVNLLKTQAK